MGEREAIGIDSKEIFPARELLIASSGYWSDE
jgi:hypothetical protein